MADKEELRRTAADRRVFALLAVMFSLPAVNACMKVIWGPLEAKNAVLSAVMFALLAVVAALGASDALGVPGLFGAPGVPGVPGGSAGPLSRDGIQTRKLPLLLCIFLAAVIIISQFDHTIGLNYVFLALSLLVCPLIALARLRRAGAAQFFMTAAWALVVAGLALAILCAALTPYGDPSERYQGVASNPNYLGMLIVGSIMGSYYVIALSEKVLPVAVAAAACCPFTVLLLLSGSRTSQGAVILQAALVAAVLLRRLARKEITVRTLAVKAAAIGLSIALCFPIIAVLNDAAQGPAAGAGGETKLSADGGEEDGSMASSSVIKSQIDRTAEALSEEGGGALSRFDRLVSGRVPIWEAYFFELNMKGHDTSVRDPVQRSTHSAFLQIAYRCGIPAGIALLLLDISVLFFGVRALTGRRAFRAEYLFVGQAAVTQLAESLMESSATPLIGSFCPAFFLIIGFAMFNKPRVG